jgi:hypothetical protein
VTFSFILSFVSGQKKEQQFNPPNRERGILLERAGIRDGIKND